MERERRLPFPFVTFNAGLRSRCFGSRRICLRIRLGSCGGLGGRGEEQGGGDIMEDALVLTDDTEELLALWLKGTTQGFGELYSSDVFGISVGTEA